MTSSESSQATSPSTRSALPKPIHPPKLHPKLVKDEHEALVQAAEQWVKRQREMWIFICQTQVQESRRYTRWSVTFRVLTILLTAAITTTSSLETFPRGLGTLLGGILSVLVALEAFFKFGERGAQTAQLQRELQAKYEELSSLWAADVQLESDLERRVARAKELLKASSKEYNDIIGRYASDQRKGAEADAELPA